MKIGMDMDGVVADLITGWETQYREAFDEPEYTHDGSWEIATGTVFDDSKAVMRYLDHVPNFWANLPLIPGAAGGCWQLVAKGHQVTFITNRGREAQRSGTSRWVESWWPQKETVPPIEFVPGYKGVIDTQCYVDDKPERLEELAHGHSVDDREWTPRPFVVVFDQPWNQDVKPARNLFRATGWSDLVDLIETVQHNGLEDASGWSTVGRNDEGSDGGLVAAEAAESTDDED